MKFEKNKKVARETPYDKKCHNYNFDIAGNKPLSKSTTLIFNKENQYDLHQKLKIITKNSIFYDEVAKVAISLLYYHYSEIKNEYEEGAHYLKDLVDVLETVDKSDLHSIKSMKK